MALNGNATVMTWYFSKIINISKGLDVNEKNSSRYPPLFLACWHGHSYKLDECDEDD